ncbi:MAG: hypothetical protein JXR76_07340 [Deltaproteobacteria bacterium]|nr:hypothetical protein [Deltaproteobacteria bacterium]
MSIGTIAGSAAAQTQSSQKGDNAFMGKEDFLKLLISQMQHQDPLEPMKNHEFVAQLATFSNVEQLVSVNEGIASLGNIQSAAYESSAASYIGKEVEVISRQMTVNGTGEPIQTGFVLTKHADNVVVDFSNSSGEVVRSIHLGAKNMGPVDIEWNTLNNNGEPVAKGVYSMEVHAADSDGNPVQYEARVRGKVDGVSYDTGTAVLQLGDLQATVANIVGVYPSKTN